MSVPLENLAMVESAWPGADWTHEKSIQLAGPRRGEDLRAHTPGRLAKFHVPEIVFGPGALAELGHCAARLGARRPFLVTDPGLIEAGWAAARASTRRRAWRSCPATAAGSSATRAWTRSYAPSRRP